MSDIELSIIIPTYNRQERLARVLAALEVQTFPLTKVQVIVVSDGSTDTTGHFLKEYRAPFKLVPLCQENQGVAVARNTGLAHATSEKVLFLDDDVIPAPELVAEHLASLRAQEKIVVLGPMLTPPDARLLPWVLWEQAMLAKQYKSMIDGEWAPTARQFYTGNTSLEKRYIAMAGGFDPFFRRAEDVELAYRLKDLNLRFIFNPKAIGYHYADRSFKSWIGIAYTYGQNDVIFSRQKKQHWLLPKIRAEYFTRNVLVRSLTRICLDRNQIQGVVVGLMKNIALGATRLHLDRLSRYCFSGIYNLRYYQGIADGLGGRSAFFSFFGEEILPDGQKEPHR